MATEAIVRKWGNSLGIIVPKEVAEREMLKPNMKVVVEIMKIADLTDVFGTAKIKMSGQQFKDMVRKGWD